MTMDEGEKLLAVGDAEFAVDMGELVADPTVGEAQGVGDDRGRQTTPDKVHDLELPGCESLLGLKKYRSPIWFLTKQIAAKCHHESGNQAIDHHPVDAVGQEAFGRKTEGRELNGDHQNREPDNRLGATAHHPTRVQDEACCAAVYLVELGDEGHFFIS